MAQLVPFQVSTKVAPPTGPSPTATQLVELVQDTLLRELLPLPWLGVATMVQLLPFHRSAIVRWTPDRLAA
jgi:hypothetical protein